MKNRWTKKDEAQAIATVSQIRGDLIVLTDEYLDYQAARFRFYEVYGLLGISFQTFLNHPDTYIDQAIAKIKALLGLPTVGVFFVSSFPCPPSFVPEAVNE